MKRVLLVGALASGLAGCSSAPPAPNEYILDCDQVDAGDSAASDENYFAFLNAEAAKTVATDPCQSPALTAPDGGTLDRNNPPVFAFTPTHAVCGLRREPATRWGCRGHPGTRSKAKRLIDLGTSLLEGTAEAHCGAFTGENYYFKLTKLGQKDPVYTAMLSVSSFTPDATVWKKALSSQGGQTLNLSIERAVFFKGTISQGPYVQPQPYVFNVAP